jgi:hypothetical protein
MVVLEQRHLFPVAALLMLPAAVLGATIIAALQREQLPLVVVEMEAQLLTVLLLPLTRGEAVEVAGTTTAQVRQAALAAPA